MTINKSMAVAYETVGIERRSEMLFSKKQSVKTGSFQNFKLYLSVVRDKTVMTPNTIRAGVASLLTQKDTLIDYFSNKVILR